MVRDNMEIKDFLSGFRKSFQNFCSKAPVVIRYFISEVGVSLSIEDPTLSYEYLFNFEFDVKENIKRIKDWLLVNAYPILLKQVDRYEKYSQEELAIKIRDGEVTLSESLKLRKTISEFFEFRIERVIIGKNQIFIRDLTTQEERIYFLSKPLVSFLKKYRRIQDKLAFYIDFEENSKLVKILDPNYKKN